METVSIFEKEPLKKNYVASFFICSHKVPFLFFFTSFYNLIFINLILRMSREIRAVYTDTTVRVYQASNDNIADAVLSAQKFVSPCMEIKSNDMD